MNPIDELRVADVMTEVPQCLEATASLADAYAYLMGEGIRGAPVVDAAGALVGVVSSSDLLAALAPVLDPQEEVADVATLRDLKGTPLSDLIERRPITCPASESLAEACQRMVRHRVRRLVVLADPGDPGGGQGAIAGVLSATDVVWALARGRGRDPQEPPAPSSR